MITLNTQLEKYMRGNSRLDKRIEELMLLINGAKHKHHSYDDSTVRELAVIRTKRNALDTLRVKHQEAQMDLRKLKLVNGNINDDCSRLRKSIEEHKFKIKNCGVEIGQAEADIVKDQVIIDKLDPEAKRLQAEIRVREAAHLKKVESLLQTRKKKLVGSHDVPSLPIKDKQVNVNAVLEDYRNDILSESDARSPQVITLEKQIQVERQRKLTVDDKFRIAEREKADYEARILTIEHEISAAERQIQILEHQIYSMRERNQSEIARLNAEIKGLVEQRRRLDAELKKAEEGLKQVMLKLPGYRERLDAEIRKMQDLLNLHEQEHVIHRVTTVKKVVKH